MTKLSAMELRHHLLHGGYQRLLKPLLFRIDHGNPESAHEFLIKSLARVAAVPAALQALSCLVGKPHDPVTVAGIRFPGRVGVAAGLDKDGVAAKAWASLGFGFAELGTVTRFAQPGNEKPRMFRLRDSQAVINRMGFNNHGAQALSDRLEHWHVKRGRATLGIPLGISIGKTKTTPVEQAVADYVGSFQLLAPYADYVAINVSSPNTPGLRRLQGKEFLTELAQALVSESRNNASDPLGPVPIFVKIAPDMSAAELDDVLHVCVDQCVSGLIVANTTLDRNGLALADQRSAAQAGGLSGAPLTIKARKLVATVVKKTDLPVIGVGGIMTAADAQAMFDVGAVLVQVYSGYIFAGAVLVSDINFRRIG